MIPFFDISSENSKYLDFFSSELKKFIAEGDYILGNHVEKFESEFAEFCGTSYCLGTSNGLDSLRLIFEAYKKIGLLKIGDEVLVPANTFIASILAVVQSGLVPVFVEPKINSFNMSYDDAKDKCNLKTKACLIVHMYGQLADTDLFKSLSEENDLILIEDSAQAHGASKNKKKAGSFGDASAFSFYPTKNIGALGDAGAITSNNTELINCIESLRNYGSQSKYNYSHLGFNMRLDSLQALFLSKKLKDYPKNILSRQRIASFYCNNVKNEKIKLPEHPNNMSHVFHLFVVKVENRNHFIDYLEKNGVGSHIHYPIPPHKQKSFLKYNHLNLPLTEDNHNKVVSIPLYPSLNDLQLKKIVDVLNCY